jgi:type IV secretion system protein VirB10
MPEKEIDAGAVLEEREHARGPGEAAKPAEVEGARGAAALAGARRAWPVGARTLFVLLGVLVAGIVTALLLKARSVRSENEAHQQERKAADETIGRRVPGLKLEPAVAAGLTGAESSQPQGYPGEAVVAAHPAGELDVVQRRLARGFGAGEGESAGAARVEAPDPSSPAVAAPGPAGGGPGAPAAGGLDEKLEATPLQVAVAGRLPDRDFLLTQGAIVDCVLETKIVSTVAGMTSCHLTRDVYSTNGRVVLLDRGSRVVGRYESGLQQGATRIFVLWTRVETPNGIVVQLQSPGTGPLGEAGVGGWVDTRFWDRFGAAILLSIIESGTDAVAARAAGSDSGPTFNIAGTTTAGKDVIAKSLEPTINIPPVVYKNQGERVAIFVARDLDFRSVYGLERNGDTERAQAGP